MASVTRRTIRIVSALAAGALLPIAAVSPAHAGTVSPQAAIVCTAHDSYADFSTKSTSYVLTHAKAYENYSAGSVTRSVTTELVGSVTASVTWTTSEKVKAGVVMDELEASTGLTLQASGTITKSSSETVTATMTHQGRYVYYSGTRKATGTWDGAVCSSNGQYWTDSSGKATSWTIDIDGVVWCGGSRPSGGSLGYIAYGKYC